MTLTVTGEEKSGSQSTVPGLRTQLEIEPRDGHSYVEIPISSDTEKDLSWHEEEGDDNNLTRQLTSSTSRDESLDGSDEAELEHEPTPNTSVIVASYLIPIVSRIIGYFIAWISSITSALGQYYPLTVGYTSITKELMMLLSGMGLITTIMTKVFSIIDPFMYLLVIPLSCFVVYLSRYPNSGEKATAAIAPLMIQCTPKQAFSYNTLLSMSLVPVSSLENDLSRVCAEYIQKIEREQTDADYLKQFPEQLDQYLLNLQEVAVCHGKSLEIAEVKHLALQASAKCFGYEQVLTLTELIRELDVNADLRRLGHKIKNLANSSTWLEADELQLRHFLTFLETYRDLLGRIFLIIAGLLVGYTNTAALFLSVTSADNSNLAFTLPVGIYSLLSVVILFFVFQGQSDQIKNKGLKNDFQATCKSYLIATLATLGGVSSLHIILRGAREAIIHRLPSHSMILNPLLIGGGVIGVGSWVIVKILGAQRFLHLEMAPFPSVKYSLFSSDNRDSSLANYAKKIMSYVNPISLFTQSCTNIISTLVVHNERLQDWFPKIPYLNMLISLISTLTLAYCGYKATKAALLLAGEVPSIPARLFQIYSEQALEYIYSNTHRNAEGKNPSVQKVFNETQILLGWKSNKAAVIEHETSSSSSSCCNPYGLFNYLRRSWARSEHVLPLSINEVEGDRREASSLLSGIEENLRRPEGSASSADLVRLTHPLRSTSPGLVRNYSSMPNRSSTIAPSSRDGFWTREIKSFPHTRPESSANSPSDNSRSLSAIMEGQGMAQNLL